MAIAISCGGSVFFADVSIQEARDMMDRGEEIRVWWYAAHGQRYTEDAWFPPENVTMIRTEHDDG